MKALAAVGLAFALLVTGVPAATAAVGGAGCGKEVYQDGSVGPVVCPDGTANADVRGALSRISPRVMALGSDATWRAVRSALCADLGKASFPIVTASYTYQFTRYGWRGTNPTPRAVSDRLVNQKLCG